MLQSIGPEDTHVHIVSIGNPASDSRRPIDSYVLEQQGMIERFRRERETLGIRGSIDTIIES